MATVWRLTRSAMERRSAAVPGDEVLAADVALTARLLLGLAVGFREFDWSDLTAGRATAFAVGQFDSAPPTIDGVASHTAATKPTSINEDLTDSDLRAPLWG